MILRSITVLIPAFLHISLASVVFQGTCSDLDVFCEQLCLTISPETYECGCWNDHNLLGDGLSCRLNSTRSDVYYEEKGKTRGGKRITTESRPPSTEETIKVLPTDSEPPLRFSGHEYAEFNADQSLYLETNITIEFKFSVREDGLLFFAGEFRGDDFISLTIQGPNLVLRYDCGEGAIEDLYRGPFGSGKWHSLTVSRKYCERTEMRMDERESMVDETKQFKYYKGITVDDGVFLGGAPSNIDFLDARAGTDRGFKGCIRKLIINDKLLLDSSSGANMATNRQKLGYCGSTENTISNETNEIESGVVEKREESVKVGKDSIRMFVIKTGTSSDSSENLPGKLFERNLVDFVRGKKVIGNNSENRLLQTTKAPLPPSPSPMREKMKIVEFTGSSYVTVPGPSDIHSYMELVIHFKPSLNQGLLMLWQDGSKYICLYLYRGFLNVQVRMGSDTATLRSAYVLANYKWHKAEVWRSGKGILLKMNHQSWIESELSSLGEKVEKSTGEVFLGGSDRPLPLHLQRLHGFHGCVKKVHLNGHLISLSTSPSLNIRECGSDPCATAGCPHGCSSRHDQFLCKCPWPTYGRTCSLKAGLSPAAMRFDGHSYLEFTSDDYMQHITGDSLRVAMEFKLSNATYDIASNHEQVLMYAGSPENSGDFIRLVVTRERTIRFSTNLGSGPAQIVHPNIVDLERWTTVEVIREQRKITISIDGLDPVTTTAPEGSEQLNVYHSLFIGGFESEEYHVEGLQGCIQMVQIGPRVIHNPSDAANSINVRECSL